MLFFFFKASIPLLRANPSQSSETEKKSVLLFKTWNCHVNFGLILRNADKIVEQNI